MAEKKQTKTRRTQVRELQPSEKRLTGAELKKVKGGVFGFEPQPLKATKPQQ
jgi:hypothetical protein